MNALAVPLIALGGLVQVGGVAYALLGFEETNLPLLVGALFVGTLIEMGGVALLMASRR